MLDRVRTISKESVAFLEERVKKDMEIARAITQAKSPADLAQLQMEYIQGLMTDYNRQAMKMAEEAGKNMTSLFGKWPGTGR
nr:phasin family protein [Prosthecomicrobium hirschii]